MEVTFTKLSDRRHTVSVVRADGTTDHIELDSRSFLRHDFAHLAVEMELELDGGFWGSVAGGATLEGTGLDGHQIALAESLAGPIQTLMRDELDAEDIRSLLDRVAPERSSDDVAQRIRERLRRLRGHWKATPYQGAMTVSWTDSD